MTATTASATADVATLAALFDTLASPAPLAGQNGVPPVRPPPPMAMPQPRPQESGALVAPPTIQSGGPREGVAQ